MKEIIYEKQASIAFIHKTTQDIEDLWPEIYNRLQNFENKFVIKYEDVDWDILIFIISSGLQIVENLYSKQHAERIKNLIIELLNMPEYQDHIINELMEYKQAWEEHLLEPYVRLLKRITGGNIDFIIDKETSVISPLFLGMFSDLILHNLVITGSEEFNFWKFIKENYELAES